MLRATQLALLAITWAVATAHTVLTYPGWRGNNLHTTGPAPQHNSDVLGTYFNTNNDTYEFPYGMQWNYPCGGMPMSKNRTTWPVKGGAISIQPGWFQGHVKALFYVNMGINGPGESAPPNMSHILVPPFQINGPSNNEYPGQFCLPQVPMPVNVSLSVGDNVTLQVVEVAQHGAALYNCVDVTLAEPADVELVTPQNCYNSSDISFDLLFTTAALSAATSNSMAPTLWPILALALATIAIGFH